MFLQGKTWTWIHFHNFIRNVSFDLFLSWVWASTRVKNWNAAQPVYTLWSPKAIKADISIAQKFIDCSQISRNAPFRFLSLSTGDCCPLTATVWFPWAVKQDHGQTTDLTMLFDVSRFLFRRMICPFWGKLWPKAEHSTSLWAIVCPWTFLI